MIARREDMYKRIKEHVSLHRMPNHELRQTCFLLEIYGAPSFEPLPAYDTFPPFHALINEASFVFSYSCAMVGIIPGAGILGVLYEQLRSTFSIKATNTAPVAIVNLFWPCWPRAWFEDALSAKRPVYYNVCWSAAICVLTLVLNGDLELRTEITHNGEVVPISVRVPVGHIIMTYTNVYYTIALNPQDVPPTTISWVF